MGTVTSLNGGVLAQSMASSIATTAVVAALSATVAAAAIAITAAYVGALVVLPPAGSLLVGSAGIMGPLLIDPSKVKEALVPLLKTVGEHGFGKVADKMVPSIGIPIVLGAVVLGTLNMGGLYLQRPRPPPPPVQPPPPTSTPPVTRHRPRFPTMEETISLADGPSDRSESSVIPRIPPSQV